MYLTYNSKYLYAKNIYLIDIQENYGTAYLVTKDNHVYKLTVSFNENNNDYEYQIVDSNKIISKVDATKKSTGGYDIILYYKDGTNDKVIGSINTNFN